MGIVIIAIISLVVSFPGRGYAGCITNLYLEVSFCGYTTLMWFERIIWFPVLVAYLVALGVSGKHLNSPPAEPASAQAILSFAAVIAGFTITYSPLGSDFTTYYSPDGPRSDLLSLQCRNFTDSHLRNTVGEFSLTRS